MNALRSDAASRALAWLAIAFVAAAAYWNSFHGEFIYDDAEWVTANPALRSGSVLSAIRNPPEAVGGRPLTMATFALNFAAGGLDVRGYHIVNVALHVSCALVLAALLRRTLRLGSMPPLARQHADGIALFAALLWAAHPLNTVVASYISQRSESLAALCCLLTLYGFHRGATGHRAWLILSVTACAAGMAAKETMVTAPLLVFLYDRAFLAGGVRAAWRQRPRYYASLAASWLLLALLMSGIGARGIGFADDTSPWRYALTQLHAVALYAKLTLWPTPLMLDHGRSLITHAIDALPYGIVVVPLLAITVFALVRNLAVGFLLGWFFLLLAPTSSVVPVALQPIAENRAYLPSVAIIVAVVLAAFLMLRRRAALPLAALLVAGVSLTLSRNRAYSTEVTIWRDNLRTDPTNSRAHFNLGTALQQKGNIDGAMAEYATTIRLDPEHAKAHCNLGALLHQRGDLAGARRLYERAVALSPTLAQAQLNLGVLLEQEEDLSAALPHLQTAARLAPGLELARQSLGRVLASLGRTDEAAAELDAALKLDPADASAHETLGLLAFNRGDFASAAAHFRSAIDAATPPSRLWHYLSGALLAGNLPAEAASAAKQGLQLEPDNADLHYILGASLLRLDQLEPARTELASAVRLAPQMTDALNNLGICQSRLGRLPEAIASFEAALRIDPKHADARQNLAAARRALKAQ